MSLMYGNGGMSPADFAAMNGNNNGFGNGDDMWIFLLFLLVWGNGWGNNAGNGGGYPAVQQGFDQAAIMGAIQGVQASINNSDISMLQGFNTLGMAMQNCCCENRLATANLGAQVASENCLTRQTVSDGFRDMLMSNYQNTQNLITAMNNGFTGLDNKLCQLEMDAKNDKIADLQRQLEQAEDNARYNGLIAAMQQSQDAQTTALEQYLHPVAVPSYNVPNPNCCNSCVNSGMCGY